MAGPLVISWGERSAMFERRFTVGRIPAEPGKLAPDLWPDIHVEDEYISNRHAGFSIDLPSDRWTVEDLGSTNGTYMLAPGPPGRISVMRRVFGPMQLRKGDRVRIGHTVFTVVPVEHAPVSMVQETPGAEIAQGGPRKP